MKYYVASEEFIDLLKRHGFVETTQNLYPGHWRDLKSMREYRPDGVKRSFKKGRARVVFDYINIYLYYDRLTPCFSSSKISESELRSYLYYLVESRNSKTYLNRRSIAITDIESFFLNEDTEFMTKIELKTFNKFKSEFDRFKI